MDRLLLMTDHRPTMHVCDTPQLFSVFLWGGGARAMILRGLICGYFLTPNFPSPVHPVHASDCFSKFPRIPAGNFWGPRFPGIPESRGGLESQHMHGMNLTNDNYATQRNENSWLRREPIGSMPHLDDKNVLLKLYCCFRFLKFLH